MNLNATKMDLDSFIIQVGYIREAMKQKISEFPVKGSYVAGFCPERFSVKKSEPYPGLDNNSGKFYLFL